MVREECVIEISYGGMEIPYEGFEWREWNGEITLSQLKTIVQILKKKNKYKTSIENLINAIWGGCLRGFGVYLSERKMGKLYLMYIGRYFADLYMY